MEEDTITTYEQIAEWWNKKYSQPNYWGKSFDEFQELLPSGTILEIGAGAGRDAKDLIARGYGYYGTEPAAKFVEIARAKNPGARFEQLSVYELEPAEYDGFWAAAVLLHIPRPRIQEALSTLRAAVRGGAIGFIVIKEGDGEVVEVQGDYPRLFTLWLDADFRVELSQAGFEVIKYHREVKSERTIWLRYIVKAI
ncbi:class I SAM-dependent methyltransferase [Candidatus Mycosynbacter amalyticus]|uniref:class I SAM-dependent methyltransferase n=1 Tax=Candidatus Mycosynbacter amalyticus TaxID=2665156 RepID=UPI0021B3C76C|nr:class I SAM-dependent methyltransferase [Candidatus Mycosynbacter amalyticus]